MRKIQTRACGLHLDNISLQKEKEKKNDVFKDSTAEILGGLKLYWRSSINDVMQ